MEVLKEIGRKIAKLIDVKSLITLILTIVVAYLAIINAFDIKEVYLMIIAFYFGTQTNKNSEKNENISKK